MVGGPARGVETAAVLAALPRDTWSVLPHAGWRRGSSTYVGHVVVGPSGVFVIEAKAWAGMVEVRDGVLRHDGRARATTIADASDSAGAVARILPFVPRGVVRGALCFERGEWLSVTAGAVLVCSTSSILEADRLGPDRPRARRGQARVARAPAGPAPADPDQRCPCDADARAAAVGSDRLGSPGDGLVCRRDARVLRGTRDGHQPRQWARTPTRTLQTAGAGQRQAAHPGRHRSRLGAQSRRPGSPP